jgi:hypothetical protein
MGESSNSLGHMVSSSIRSFLADLWLGFKTCHGQTLSLIVLQRQ